MANEYQKIINKHLRDLNKIGLAGTTLYDFKNKELCLEDLIEENLNKLLSLADIENLPDNFTKNDILTYLFTFGHCAMIKHNEEYWPMFGGLCGLEKSPLYQPTQITIANPALQISKRYTNDVDCVIIRCDYFYNGILDILRRYCTLLVEGNLSLLMYSNLGSRLTAAISSDDEDTRNSAQDFIDNIINGEYTTIAEGKFDPNLNINPFMNTSTTAGVLQLLEMLQYIDAEKNKTFGIGMNNNRKREALSSEETSADDLALLPWVDSFMFYLEDGLNRCNELWGTDWKVKKSSSWEIIEDELEFQQDMEEENVEEKDEDLDEKEEDNNETDPE